MANDYEITINGVPNVLCNSTVITTNTRREAEAYICGLRQAFGLLGYKLECHYYPKIKSYHLFK